MKTRSDRHAERGYSLIELPVALLVAAILALAIFGLFRAGLVLGQRRAHAIAAGEAAIGLDVIARTMREGSRDPKAILIWPGGNGEDRHDAVVVRTARGEGGEYAVGGEGQPAWTGWTGFVHDAGRRVIRRVEFRRTESVPAPPWEGGSVVVRQAQSFTVDRRGEQVDFTVVLESKGSVLTLRSVVRPRNR